MRTWSSDTSISFGAARIPHPNILQRNVCTVLSNLSFFNICCRFKRQSEFVYSLPKLQFDYYLDSKHNKTHLTEKQCTTIGSFRFSIQYWTDSHELLFSILFPDKQEEKAALILGWNRKMFSKAWQLTHGRQFKPFGSYFLIGPFLSWAYCYMLLFFH